MGSTPVTTWKDVAALVGVSVHTVMRRRREAGDFARMVRPYFETDRAARDWYVDLLVSRHLRRNDTACPIGMRGEP